MPYRRVESLAYRPPRTCGAGDGAGDQVISCQLLTAPGHRQRAELAEDARVYRLCGCALSTATTSLHRLPSHALSGLENNDHNGSLYHLLEEIRSQVMECQGGLRAPLEIFEADQLQVRKELVCLWSG